MTDVSRLEEALLQVAVRSQQMYNRYTSNYIYVCVCVCVCVCGVGMRWRSREVAVSIPDGAIGIFPSGRTIVALWSTQPLAQLSTRNISWRLKAADA